MKCPVHASGRRVRAHNRPVRKPTVVGIRLTALQQTHVNRYRPTDATAGEVRDLVACRRRGTRWSVEYCDRTVVVDDSVGMGYLATLLANPGCAIPAVDLAAGAGAGSVTGAKGSAGSSDPILDDTAVRAYRRRLASLREDIDEHEANHDLHRAEQARAERDWLVAQLSAATGLGGRMRQFTGNEERARIAVGKAIRRALDRIADADPVTGAALRAAVHTGMRCLYQPDDHRGTHWNALERLPG